MMLLMCLLNLFVTLSCMESSTFDAREVNNIVISDGDDALVDYSGEVFYTRSRINLMKMHANGKIPEKCRPGSQKMRIAIIRDGNAYDCHLKGYLRDGCSFIGCNEAQNCSMILSRNSVLATARAEIVDRDNGEGSTVISFECTLETPVGVTLQTQTTPEIAVDICQLTSASSLWESALRRPLYSFRYFDNRYIVVANKELDGTSSAQLVAVEKHSGQHIWRAQSYLSCRATDSTVILNYTCATAAVMVKSDTLREDTLYIAFYHGENSSCEKAQDYDEYHEALNGGTTVVCAYPMSHSERNVRAEGQEVMHLERTHTFQMKFTIIDEQPMLLFLEHGGFYVYGVADDLPKSLINYPAYGHWKSVIKNARRVFLNSKREVVVMTASSVATFDLDACSKALTCNDCMSADHLYCGWCILEKKCSTLHGCASAVKHTDITKRLWLHAKRHTNKSCPKLSPYIAGTTMSSEALIKSFNKNKSEFIFSGSHFPLKGAYTDDLTCRMAVSKNKVFIYPSLPAQRPKFRHDRLHAEFRCSYPKEVVNLISNTSSYQDIDTGILELAVTLSYSQRSRRSLKSIDWKTVTVGVVLCEKLDCIQCAKVSEACTWNSAKESCGSLLRTSPEEVSKVEPVTTKQDCKNTETVVSQPRIPHLHTNLPTQLPKNFSYRPILFLGENLDVLNVTALDTSVGMCSVIHRNISSITCLMSGEFVRENVTIRIYTDDRTTVCSHCRFELFDEDTQAPLFLISTTGVTNQTETTTYAPFQKFDLVLESTRVPDASTAFFSGTYLLIFICVAGVLLAALLGYLARLRYVTKKNSDEIINRQKETHPLVQVHPPTSPPPVPPRNTAPIGANNSYLSVNGSAVNAENGSRLSHISIPEEEAPPVAAHLYEAIA